MTLLPLSFEDQAQQFWFYGQIFVFFFLVVCFIMMLQMKRKTDMESQKAFHHGFAWFIFTTIIAQGLFLLEETWGFAGNGDLLPRFIRIGGTGYEYTIFICFAFGFIFLMKPIEMYILNKDKLRITALNKVAAVCVTVPYVCSAIYHPAGWIEIWTLIAYPGIAVFAIAALFSMFGSFLFYIRLGIRGTGSIKRKGYLIGFGIILMYIALLAGSQVASDIGGWAGAILGPGVMILGSLMVIVGHRIEM